jgi:hypothetical protein
MLLRSQCHKQKDGQLCSLDMMDQSAKQLDSTTVEQLSEDIATLKDTVQELTSTLKKVTPPRKDKPMFQYSSRSFKSQAPKTSLFAKSAMKKKQERKQSGLFDGCDSWCSDDSDSNQSHSSKPAGQKRVTSVKLPPFTGNESWKIWYTRFSDVAARHRWSEEQQLDELLPRLHGAAAEFVFDQLCHETRRNYEELVAEMNSRFRHVETTRAYAARFSNRRQKPGEMPEDYAADLKKLYDKAHKNRDQVTRQEDLLRRYLDGLSDDQVRFHVEFIKEPDNIDEAVFQTVNFNETRGRHTSSESHATSVRHHVREAVVQQSDDEDAEKEPQRKGVPTKKPPTGKEKATPAPVRDRKNDSNSEVEALRKKVAEQEAKIAELCNLLPQASSSQKPALPKYGCFRCGDKGHFIRDCPVKLQAPDQASQYVPGQLKAPWFHPLTMPTQRQHPGFQFGLQQQQGVPTEQTISSQLLPQHQLAVMTRQPSEQPTPLQESTEPRVCRTQAQYSAQSMSNLQVTEPQFRQMLWQRSEESPVKPAFPEPPVRQDQQRHSEESMSTQQYSETVPVSRSDNTRASLCRRCRVTENEETDQKQCKMSRSSRSKLTALSYILQVTLCFVFFLGIVLPCQSSSVPDQRFSDCVMTNDIDAGIDGARWASWHIASNSQFRQRSLACPLQAINMTRPLIPCDIVLRVVDASLWHAVFKLPCDLTM